MGYFRDLSVVVILFAVCGTGVLAQFDFSCVAGQQPGYPFNLEPCNTCVSADYSAHCSTGETECTWGYNPTDPNCALPPTMAPENKCHPDDVPPTIDPFIAGFLPGGQPCLACLNVETYYPGFQRCAGNEGEICDWLDCGAEVGEVAAPIPKVTEAPQNSQLPCQLGDNLPVSTDGQCLACLNGVTLQLCRGDANEACFWRDCAHEVVPVLLCQPGTKLDVPDLPESCNLDCINWDTEELCTDGDVYCDWKPFNASCVMFNTTVTVRPCPSRCLPGQKFIPIPDMFPDCFLDCINIETNELCVEEDLCCQYEVDFELSCFGAPPTTTMPESVCQPGDISSIPPEIACFKCLSRNGAACLPDVYCEWKQLDKTQCEVVVVDMVTLKSTSTTDKTQAPGITSKEKRFSVTFELDNCRSVLDDEKRTEEFIREFAQQIEGLIGTHPTEIDLTCGSIIVDFTIVKEENDKFNLDTITEQLKQEVDNGKLNIKSDGKDLTASAFEDITKETDPPKKKPRTDSFTPIFWYLVVGVIGIVVVAVFMIMVYAYLDYHWRHNRSKVPPRGSDNKTYTQDSNHEPRPKLTSDFSYFEEDEQANDYFQN